MIRLQSPRLATLSRIYRRIREKRRLYWGGRLLLPGHFNFCRAINEFSEFNLKSAFALSRSRQERVLDPPADSGGQENTANSPRMIAGSLYKPLPSSSSFSTENVAFASKLSTELQQKYVQN